MKVVKDQSEEVTWSQLKRRRMRGIFTAVDNCVVDAHLRRVRSLIASAVGIFVVHAPIKDMVRPRVFFDFSVDGSPVGRWVTVGFMRFSYRLILFGFQRHI